MQPHCYWSWAVLTTFTLGITTAAAQQPARPGEPDPTDRGGEFTLSGCLTRPAAQQQEGPVFIVTKATAATGEGRLVGAMGAGVPTPGQTNPRPHDPPDIVDAQYRVIADDADISLGSHVDRKVEMRGRLMDRDWDSQSGSAKAERTFMAAEVRQLADSCE